MTTVAQESHEPHEHGNEEHLAHHWDTPKQQFDAGKLGIWLFLTTEILLFSGLFCAYSVYRANHPEVFEYAHLYLNKWLGAVNTIVLIFSSLTMAWGVRAAQLGQKKLLVTLLGITLACGGVFMCVKFVEYKDKWSHGTLWAGEYHPHVLPGGVTKADVFGPGGAAAATPTLPNAPATQKAFDGPIFEGSTVARAPAGPAGLSAAWVEKESAREEHLSVRDTERPWTGPVPKNTQIFFSIYFLMTGLHGLHVLAGMAVIGWIMLRASRGEFGPKYFNPVDFVGLYWHVVDIVWIFLFPLLYLIH